jgi:hypothetical protein
MGSMQSLFDLKAPVASLPTTGLDVSEELALKLFGGTDAASQETATRFALETTNVASRRSAPAFVTVHSADITSQSAADELLEVCDSLQMFGFLRLAISGKGSAATVCERG